MNDLKKRRIRDTDGGPGTLISDGCKFEGKFTGQGNFIISGEIEGECDVAGTVTLAKEGHWRGTIKADSVIVAGVVEGNINASGRVEISDTAKVSGVVISEAIAVAEGAVVDGEMQTTGREPPIKFVEKRVAKTK